VAGIAAAGSLESSTRAVSVLVGWADASDKKLGMAALETIAALQNRPIEAAMANDRLAEFREAAAIEAIKELGGRFDYDRQFGMIGGPSTPLQVIIGPKWKGGAEGLKHVAALRSATTLSLHSAPLGDEVADQLVALPQVKRIELYGTTISAEAVAKLKPQLPNVDVDVRSGARLGIRGLVIEQVVDDSPAAVAGLERNDKITEFAGQPIETFEQLTQQIAKCKPGDTVTVKALRGGATVEKKVTFDRWGDDERSTMPGAEGQQGFVPMQIQGGGRVIVQPGGPIMQNVPIQVLPEAPIPAEQRR
jgi:membrane-associated protease RseP (regulator of RpoE activity)